MENMGVLQKGNNVTGGIDVVVVAGDENNLKKVTVTGSGKKAIQMEPDEEEVNGNPVVTNIDFSDYEIDEEEQEEKLNEHDEGELSSSSSSSSESEGEEEDGINRDETAFLDVTIPYKTAYVYGENSIQEYFLPGVPVWISITDYIHQPASHRLNPNLYTIQLKHGKFEWVLEKRFKHFTHVRNRLEVFRASLVVKHPTMATRLEKVPKLPMRPELALRSEKSKNRRTRKLQKFLQSVVSIDKYRNNLHVLDFLGVSHVSFIEDFGAKQKECKVLKKSGGHTFRWSLMNKVNPAWHSRWLILRNDFISYIDKEKNVIRDVLLFDEKFDVTCDRKKTGMKNGLLISNNTRNLMLKFQSERQASLYLGNIVQVMGSKGSDWIRAHHYQSFAPIRRNSWIKWFIDGCDYFSDVADAIKKATEEIFITDWWLSPELILKRPNNPHKWRLDVLLKERAEAGVKIFILLYKEIEMTLSINSDYTKNKLMSLHENIKVIRHPDHFVTSNNPVFYWAHHEKLVCIDQKIAFTGGLDLCYGRWDDLTHRLTDFGSATPNFFKKTDSAIAKVSNLVFDANAISSEYHKNQLQEIATSNSKWFMGKDYCNPYVQDVSEVDKPFTDLIDRNELPRMPWHDVGCVVFGHAARDIARHFIERWNFTKHLKFKETIEMPFLLPKFKIEPEDCHQDFNVATAASVQILRSASQWSTGLLSDESSIYEAYKDNIRNAKYYVYIENQFFITTKSRDIINEIGDLLVQRILTAFNNQDIFRVYIVMPLLPAFPGEIGTSAATSTCFVEHWNLNSARTMINRLKENGVEDPSNYISFYGLRNYANHRGKMVSEVVYVHSKLMIVDDSVVIMGSANINDRSMLGSRDSELAVCVQDNVDTMTGKMNGVDVKVGRFAATLRRKLFQEHLGLMNEPYYTVIDPISDHFYNGVWRARAKKNSDIYEQVFSCLPSNKVKCFADLETFKNKETLHTTDPHEARNLLHQIEGFIVEKPLDFLMDQDLFPAADSKERLVPVRIFT